MGDETMKTFHEQMSEERAYYLGKSDTIPGTTKKVSEARAEAQARREEANMAMEQRRLAYLRREQPQEGVVRTTVVTPGVLADVTPLSQVEVSEKEIEAIESGAADNMLIQQEPELPARAALKREGKETLYERAAAVRDLPPIEDVTVDKLIDVILDENVNIE